MTPEKQEKTGNILLDSSEEISPEEIAKIDFSQKPSSLKQLDAALERERRLLNGDGETFEGDPFRNLYILTYKSTGPISILLFHSNKVPSLIVRDCQVYCGQHGYRYISFHRALVDLTKLGSVNRPEHNSSDVTEMVTRQSQLFNSSAAVRDQLSNGPVKD